MIPTSNAIAAGAETSPHLNANVLAYRGPPAKPETTVKRLVDKDGVAKTTYSPSAYMMLVSRLEGMIRRGSVDRDLLVELGAQLNERLAHAPEQARQRIQALGEYSALGVEKFAALPERIVTNLQEQATARTALELLKQPGFAAVMKIESSAQLYGPGGVLRAS